MKIIEDIVLNFNDLPYEFYEWNDDDKITHIKSISTMKVSDKVLKDFLYYKIKVDSNFLNNIKNKTEVYTYTSCYKLNYLTILYNDNLALALRFNEQGICTGKSRLLFDEEDEIIKDSADIITNIKYKVIDKTINISYVTRYERGLINYLCKYLDNLYNDKKFEAIKYYYLECYDKEKNIKESYRILKDSIMNNDYDTINKLKKIIKLVKN